MPPIYFKYGEERGGSGGMLLLRESAAERVRSRPWPAAARGNLNSDLAWPVLLLLLVLLLSLLLSG